MEVHLWKGNESVEVGIEGTVGTITLQRPFRRNSMDQNLVEGVRKSLLCFADDQKISALVLRGAEPGFCAGSDLKYISELDIRQISRFEQECGDLGRLIGFIDKPVIAAVEGFAIGGGLTLATCCDLVVSSTDAKWSLPEVPIGWLTPWGISSIINRVGLVEARRLCFGLDSLDGNEARRLGLVDYVTDPGKTTEYATALAWRIGELPGPAVKATKRFFSTYAMEKSEAMDFEANRLFCENATSSDAQKTFDRFRQPKQARHDV